MADAGMDETVAVDLEPAFLTTIYVRGTENMASNVETMLFVAPASRRLFDIVSKVQKLPARCRRYKTAAEVLIQLRCYERAMPL
jgi:hypothetical protein